MDKSKSIFGNAMSGRTYKKAVAGKKKYIRRLSASFMRCAAITLLQLAILAKTA